MCGSLLTQETALRPVRPSGVVHGVDCQSLRARTAGPSGARFLRPRHLLGVGDSPVRQQEDAFGGGIDADLDLGEEEDGVLGVEPEEEDTTMDAAVDVADELEDEDEGGEATDGGDAAVGTTGAAPPIPADDAMHLLDDVMAVAIEHVAAAFDIPRQPIAEGQDAEAYDLGVLLGAPMRETHDLIERVLPALGLAPEGVVQYEAGPAGDPLDPEKFDPLGVAARVNDDAPGHAAPAARLRSAQYYVNIRHEPIYPKARATLLVYSFAKYAIKVQYHLTDAAFDAMIKVDPYLHMEGNNMPGSAYLMRKILGLPEPKDFQRLQCPCGQHEWQESDPPDTACPCCSLRSRQHAKVW